MALDALTVGIQQRRVSWVLDADIRGFLDPCSYCTPIERNLQTVGVAGLIS